MAAELKAGSHGYAVVLPSGSRIILAGSQSYAAPDVEFSNNAGAVVVGSGSDVLALNLNEDYFLGGSNNGNAQFTISVDGTQVGGVQTATAQAYLDQSQTFDVEGNFGPGAHTVSVDFLNDAYGSPGMDRNLYVTGASYNGTAVPDASLALLAGGTQSFSVNAQPTPASTVTVGSGPDDLALHVSEDAYQGDAQYTVSVDGVQEGGVLTAAASHSAGQDQTVNVLGDFGTGAHTVAVNFLNDLYDEPGFDRNLYVDSATINNETIGPGQLALLAGGPEYFIFGAAPTSPAPVTIGAG